MMMELGTRQEQMGSQSNPKFAAPSKTGFVEGLNEGATISSSLFQVHVNTPEGLIDMAAETVLLIKRGAKNELSEVEIEQQMRVISAYRFVFARARALLTHEKSKKTIELNQLLATKRREIIKDISDWRQQQKEIHKTTASWFGSITKQEIEERLCLDNSYLKFMNELSLLEEQIDTLAGLEDAINSHGFILKALSDRNVQQRFKME